MLDAFYRTFLYGVRTALSQVCCCQHWSFVLTYLVCIQIRSTVPLLLSLPPSLPPSYIMPILHRTSVLIGTARLLAIEQARTRTLPSETLWRIPASTPQITTSARFTGTRTETYVGKRRGSSTWLPLQWGKEPRQ